MSDIALRPRSVTELIDAAFQVYRRSPTVFIVVAAVGYIPWQLVVLWLSPSPGAVTVGDPAAAFRPIFISGLGGLLVYPLVAGTLNVVTADIVNGVEPDIAAAVGIALRKYFVLVVATLIRAILSVIGFALLIFPGLYVLARLFGIVPAIVIEGAGLGGSLGRSSTLSEGLKLHIFGAFALMFLIYFAISAGVGVVAGVIVQNQLVSQGISIVLAPVIAPLIHILEALVYYDARVRREGLDLEMLAGALPPSGAVQGADS